MDFVERIKLNNGKLRTNSSFLKDYFMDYLEKQIINFQRCTGLVQGKLGPERPSHWGSLTFWSQEGPGDVWAALLLSTGI